MEINSILCFINIILFLCGVALIVMSKNKKWLKKSLIKGYDTGKVKITNLQKHIRTYDKLKRALNIFIYLTLFFLATIILIVLYNWYTAARELYLLITFL